MNVASAAASAAKTFSERVSAQHVDRQERDADQVQGGERAVEELAVGDGGRREMAGDDAAGDREREQGQ